ncbi:MAG: hypothetical protein KGL18_14420 [Burkholderiales bacterium]|nr:glycoside hydrolase family 13 protein [Burkholderiales bacterium]MDE1926397.1 hypothetical protein [Burkholderiales bacterium]MDE2157792.1 hypothetical protein [Burkholderiales bacterium]MDE2504154.1 hypothetical protein [Burkholderiales bacterium]
MKRCHLARMAVNGVAAAFLCAVAVSAAAQAPVRPASQAAAQAASQAAPPAAPPQAPCTPDPLPGRTLYLRGSMNAWAPDDDWALRWICDAYYINVDLNGRYEFKIGDADWSRDATFSDGTGNYRRRFSGAQTLRLALAGGQGRVTLGPKSVPDAVVPVVTDPVALSLHFDSRAARDKRPFGAVPAGTEIHYRVAARPGVAAVSLVVERRRLEGDQTRLEYRELARVPMRRSASGWVATYRYEHPGVYGYWFDAEVGGRRVLLQNNRDRIYWTREAGSGGVGLVTPPPMRDAAIRRFRQTVYAADFHVPRWAADAVYYGIFPDRFRNGDPSNDPRPGVARYHDVTVEFHRHWLDKPYKPGSGDGSDAYYSNDFFGGDIAGIIDKLDDLRNLGVNVLYINPLFRAASNHKYDTADYRHIDPGFGTNQDFVRLTREAARRGIRILLDSSFNHSGSDSIYFDRYGNFKSNGAYEGGHVNPASPYAGWYRFEPGADPPYHSWSAAGDLPEFDKSNPAVRGFFYADADSITRLWLRRGAAGWRMDVVPWIPDDFWRAWRQVVKATRPDALTLAETWFDASKYFVGDMFDSTMNYIFRNAVLDYAGGGKAQPMVANLEHLREAYPPQVQFALMNLLSSHDVARSLYVLGWHGDDAAAEALAKRRMRLAVFLQMSYPGAPMIYYGDEVGMTGGDDPYNRGTYPWPDLGGHPDLALRAEFQRLIAMRRAHPVLRRGSTHAPLHVDDAVVVWWRKLGAVCALTAVNNAEQARRVAVDLPAGCRARAFVDGLSGATVAAHARRVEFEVPALDGRFLESRR